MNPFSDREIINLNDDEDIADSKAAAYEREIDRADILRNSLRVADEISAEHLRATPAASPPRFFRETSTGMTWEFRNGKMTTGGEDSLFHDPDDILGCLDVVETDENGNQIATDK